MAKTKIPFSKLSLKKLEEVKIVNINDLDIEVRQYLPIEEKLQLIGEVITLAADGNNFMNPVKTQTFAELEIIFYYSNLTFTDKQKEDLAKLYDLLKENKVVEKIISAIPEEEFESIFSGIFECSESLYEQANSIKTVLESVLRDYDETDMDATKIQEKLADPKNLSFLREVLDKLG